ncbi:pectin lyase fold/virulence factor [Mycena albidolilacea]|uniref:endo-polygalacturonase n=1 Tax=Mycena albidolilacea TaxID=1033008 RepID=A0AAD7EII5_9AGAR|nr:pectin lyase fold/virulence factor [Mycena albidolilacea]
MALPVHALLSWVYCTHLNMLSLSVILASISVASATFVNMTSVVPSRKVGKRCTGEIFSLADVAAAQECTTINIAGFTVPAGQTFSLSPPDGAVVSMTGQITFAVTPWAGPLMVIRGNDITFNGNSHNLVGNGDQYWDGLGGSGGIQKPAPMITLDMSGTFENVVILNSPQRAVAINTDGLTVSGVTVNNAAGAAANSRSAGKPAGANTDASPQEADVATLTFQHSAANNIVIQNSVVTNQDDCLAINRGTNIKFTGNSCTGGHGISIMFSVFQGSISSNTVVSGVTISNNIGEQFYRTSSAHSLTPPNPASNQQVRTRVFCGFAYLTFNSSGNALRIKTDATATGSTVSNIVYSGNKGSATQFGVLIDQSYPSVLGTPGTGVVISGVSFTGTNTLTVGSTGHRVEVNCGSTSSCTGTWNFAGLAVTGGTGSTVKNAPVTGGSF